MNFCISEGAGATPQAGGGGDDELVPSRLDLRVGKITSIKQVGSCMF